MRRSFPLLVALSLMAGPTFAMPVLVELPRLSFPEPQPVTPAADCTATHAAIAACQPRG